MLRTRVTGEVETVVVFGVCGFWVVVAVEGGALRKRGVLASCEGAHISTCPLLRPPTNEAGSPV